VTPLPQDVLRVTTGPQPAARPPRLLAWVKALIPRRGLKIEIVKRLNAGFKILPKRWVVERTFAWLAFYRRLAKDYQRKTKHSEATTYIASCKSCSPSL
jgi:transposase